MAFEVGSSAHHHRRGLAAFEARFPRFRERCYLVSPDAPARLPEHNLDGFGTLPLDLFLVAVGAQAAKQLKDRLRGHSTGDEH